MMHCGFGQTQENQTNYKPKLSAQAQSEGVQNKYILDWLVTIVPILQEMKLNV